MGKKKSLARVWELCEPHPDVFSGELNLTLFAASLHQVETGDASADYTEPERFFEKTFMTKSLENLLEGVLGRLSGEAEKGAPVLQLQTPCGGGKTHTLVALYELVREADEARTAPSSELLTKLLRAAAPALILMKHLRAEALGAQTLAERIWRSLKEQGLLLETLAPGFLMEFIWPKGEDKISLRAF